MRVIKFPTLGGSGNITDAPGMSSTLKTLQASVLSMSELQSNPIYVSARVRICSTRVNLNRQAVTKAFIEEVVANKHAYIALPLYADVRRLVAKDYTRLGHMYDPRTGKFYTEQIGSFVDFEVIEDEYGTSLIGEFRISRRNDEICESIVELFEMGKLRVSFEVYFKNYTRDENGVITIDASDTNKLVSACVVSTPAYPEAEALALVAETLKGVDLAKINTAELDAANMVSEISLETLATWVYEYLEMLGIIGSGYDAVIERVGPDFAIIYTVRDGKTYKLEFGVLPDGLELFGLYEVEFVRRLEKGNELMRKDNLDVATEVAEVQTPEAVEPEVAEDVEVAEAEAVETTEADAPITAEQTEEAAEEAGAEATEAESECDPVDVAGVADAETAVAEEPEASLAEVMVMLRSIAEALSALATLDKATTPEPETVVAVADDAEVATASEDSVRIDAPDKGDQLQQNIEDAEARMQEDREVMTRLAEAHGFDTSSEPVSAAISALDYKALLECETNRLSADVMLNGVVDDIDVGNPVKHPSLEKE